MLDEKFEQFYAQYDDDKYGLSDDDYDEDDDNDEDDDTMVKQHDKHLLNQAVEDFENNFKIKCKMLVYNNVCIIYDYEYVKSFAVFVT